MRWLTLGALAAALLALGVGGALPLRVTSSSETVSGVQVPTQFLSHWQQVGSMAGVTPSPLPPRWSGAVGTPSRLPRASSVERIDAGTSGNTALVWVFNETAGVPLSTELGLTFHIQYRFGAVSTTSTITVYVETQGRALTGPLTFTVYWDSGSAGFVTFVNQLALVQVCPTIGVCP